MDVVASMSNDSQEMLWIDDTSGGQTISLVNGCAIGSFDFKTDPYLPDSVYVKAGNFIAFNDKYNRTRLYTIMTVEGDDELDVHCEDIGLDLINEMANAWNFETDQTLDFYLNQVFGNSSWKVVYEASGLSTQTRHLKFDNNTDTKLSRLESIMSGFGFEGDFQITMEYMSVKSMEFHVYKTLGNKTEYDISKIYIDSINLISLNRSESIDDLYTAVLPTGGTVEGKPIDISSIEYDDGQFWTTKGDNKLYDRLAAQKWSRFAGTSAQDKTKDPAYIYGHYSSNTTAVGTLFNEALANLKEHHDVKLSYEAKLLDLDSDLGDWINIVDHAKQQDVYLKARIQEVTNHYTISGEDEGKLANYKLLSSANGDTIRNLLNQIQEKVSKVTVSDLYFTIDDQGSYAPINAEWSANQPDIPEGKFLWIKTVDKYSDGTERVTYTVTKNKTDYHGPATVVSRVPVYFLSTSQYSALKEDGSVPEKSDWITTQPAYKDDRYFWKREIVTWSDGSVDYTFATYDQQMTEAYKKLADANKDILNLQDQVDGLIESWSADPVPTLTNYPANEWTTDTAKKNHIGDLYYDKSNKCYRFMQNSDGSFSWKLIADTDVTKAIADAQKALDATDQSVTGVTTEYYASTSSTELKGGSWSEDRPAWTETNYIWSRTKTTTKAGITTYSSPSCIQGNSGTDGKDGISPTVAISKTDGSTTITITDKNGTHSQVVKDGVNGTPGATGADGKTSYFHVKYSNDGGKTFTPNNGEEVGTYIGTYSDFKIEDSTSVSAYTWAKIKGEQGERGLQGIQGKQGEQGIPGKDGSNGTNGKTSYFHIKYSSVANPTSSSQMTETPSTYIGTYVDYTETDSSDPSKYTWSRFQGVQGDKGEKGIPGIDGTNGKTSYLHIAYANSADGKTGFDVSDSANKLYIGQYTDFNPTDSTDYTKYSWTKIKGEQGERGLQGIQGKQGEQGIPGKDGSNGTNGKTSYFHIKYSSVANPTSSSQMTETPSTYIGTYVDYTETDSSDPSKYTWSRFQGVQGDKGEKGIPGIDGTNGKTSYLHIAYANSADGKTGFDVSDSANKLYIGQYTDFNPTDSTDYTKYSWTKIKGETGAKGNDGTSVKITAKSVTYQASTSGTTTPTGVWVADPPTVAKGQYLWTKTVVTYSDGNSTTAYSVAYQGTNGTNGQNGTNGIGVKSTEVTYQIWANGTTTPNGAWVTTVPDTTADNPYLWTRTIITYTDNTKSTSYSVGSTLKGVNVGGRNLLLNSRNPKDGEYYIVANSGLSPTGNLFKNCTIFSCKNAWNSLRVYFNKHVTERNVVHVGDKLTYSIYAKTDNNSVINIMMFNRTFDDTTGQFNFDSQVRSFPLTKEWAQYSITFTVTDSILKTSGTGMTYFGFEITSNAESGKYVYFACPKLELGNIATDWTPAPEDVDADISNAQNSANQANANASAAKQDAANANSSAQQAGNTANAAKKDAESANSAIQAALKQIAEIQTKSNEAKKLASDAWNGVSPIAQVVKVDDKGLKVLNSKDSTNYAQMQDVGFFIFVSNNQVAEFGENSKMRNIAIQDYMMFGSHRAETTIIKEEESTAFYWIGDVK